jgi:hypothetical protein
MLRDADRLQSTSVVLAIVIKDYMKTFYAIFLGRQRLVQSRDAVVFHVAAL